MNSWCVSRTTLKSIDINVLRFEFTFSNLWFFESCYIRFSTENKMLNHPNKKQKHNIEKSMEFSTHENPAEVGLLHDQLELPNPGSVIQSSSASTHSPLPSTALLELTNIYIIIYITWYKKYNLGLPPTQDSSGKWRFISRDSLLEM